MMNKQIHFQQLESRMKGFMTLKKTELPQSSVGWIRSIRKALGMSLEQLGRKLSLTKQSIQGIENREAEGGVTIKALREVADALEMELVYGFVPKQGSLQSLVERKARNLAGNIVLRSANTMKLKDYSVSDKQIERAIKERTKSILKELPKFLWD